MMKSSLFFWLSVKNSTPGPPSVKQLGPWAKQLVVTATLACRNRPPYFRQIWCCQITCMPRGGFERVPCSNYGVRGLVCGLGGGGWRRAQLPKDEPLSSADPSSIHELLRIQFLQIGAVRVSRARCASESKSIPETRARTWKTQGHALLATVVLVHLASETIPCAV